MKPLIFLLFLLRINVLVAGSPTTVEQYETLYHRVFDHVFSPVDINESIPVVLNHRVLTPSIWLMEKQLYQWIQEKGFEQVYTSRPDSTSWAYRIDYQPVSNRVRYDVYPSDPDSLQRTLQVECYLRWIHPDKRLILSTTRKDSITDIIGRDELERIETPQLPYTRGEIPESGDWRRFIDPALVSVLTGMVIYSFYSVRSR